MAPQYVAGGGFYGGIDPIAFLTGWPAGQFVCARIRGGCLCIWSGVEATGIRAIQTSPAGCETDTTLDALIAPDHMNPACIYNGGVAEGNIQADGIVDLFNFDMEAVGFSITNGELLISESANAVWTGATIGPLVGPDGITFPINGGGSGQSNLADSAGGQLYMMKFEDPSDSSLLYVCIIAGAQGPAEGLNPQAPGWDLVQSGVLFQIFTWAAGGAGGATTPPPTSDVVTDICERAGLLGSQIDVSLLQVNGNIQPNAMVLGFVCERPTPASQLLKVLMQAYLFDGVEEDGIMKWIPRGLASKFTIPEADLGTYEDGAKIKPETFAQAHDLPRFYEVLYNDPTLDYQQGRQSWQANSRLVQTNQREVLSVPMTMTPDWAMQLAQKLLYIRWLERQGFTFRLFKANYMKYSPTDVLKFVYEGLTFQIRVSEQNIGQNFVTELVGINDNASAYLSSATGGAGGGGFGGGGGIGGGKIVGPTTLLLLDIPLVSDADSNTSGTGVYAAMTSAVTGWPGSMLENSPDDSVFSEVPGGTTQAAADYGVATTVLGNPRSPWSWDMVSTVTVRMIVGSPESNTQLAVLNGANTALLGGEIIQFMNALDNGDGTWTLSGLLRARRGTEWAIGTHAVNESFVLLPVVRVSFTLSIIGQDLFWAAVTIGQDITAAAVQQVALTGADRKPYAPVAINASRDGSQNLTVNWTRRTRIGGAWIDGIGVVPVSEDDEEYQIDILNGSTVVRTIDVVAMDSNSIAAQPTLTYSAADQTTDFGSPQSSVALKIYQMSGEVGRGFAAPATV
jgi:hypothetical protein